MPPPPSLARVALGFKATRTLRPSPLAAVVAAGRAAHAAASAAASMHATMTPRRAITRRRPSAAEAANRRGDHHRERTPRRDPRIGNDGDDPHNIGGEIEVIAHRGRNDVENRPRREISLDPGDTVDIVRLT